MNNKYILFIISTVPPYGYEVNKLLALPNGFLHQVRYRARWIAMDKPQDLAGCKGLVLLRVFETARIIPLRRVLIKSVTQIGNLYYISLRLDDIVEFSSSKEVRSQQLRRCEQLLDNILASYMNKPAQDISAAVIPATDPTYFIEDSEFSGNVLDRPLNAWGNLIEILGELDYYKGFDFLRVVHITNTDEKRADIIPTSFGAVYALNGGVSYNLTLLQLIPMSSVARVIHDKDGKIIYPRIIDKTLELYSQRDELNFLTSSAPVEGRHDIYRFTFRTTEDMNELRSTVVVKLQKMNGPVAPQLLSELTIPIIIKASQVKRVIRIISLMLFLMAGAIVLIPEFLQNHISIIQFTSPNNTFSVIQRLALVVLVLTSWSFPRAEKWISKLFGM